jgi:hypothetical protein
MPADLALSFEAVSNDREGTIPIGNLVAGFLAARERFETARLGRDPVRPFHPLFEALAWAVTLDERLGYPDDPQLRGLRYARNAVHHQWADALELDDSGAAFPITFPMVFFEWRWTRELPPPKQKRDEPFYREHLAGHPARHALGAVAAHLAQ